MKTELKAPLMGWSAQALLVVWAVRLFTQSDQISIPDTNLPIKNNPQVAMTRAIIHIVVVV